MPIDSGIKRAENQIKLNHVHNLQFGNKLAFLKNISNELTEKENSDIKKGEVCLKVGYFLFFCFVFRDEILKKKGLARKK